MEQLLNTSAAILAFLAIWLLIEGIRLRIIHRRIHEQEHKLLAAATEHLERENRQDT